MATIRPNPLSQVTFILSLVFSVVYLSLGIVLVGKYIIIPWLDFWLQLVFGIGMILYAGVRLYRAYMIYQESKDYER